MNEGGARDPQGGARDPQGGARDPEAEARVSRLLAEAGGPEPMPPEVAARLDDVLADLERDRTATTATADVAELRARRRWPRLLLAAAAVVVGGYGVSTVLTQGTLSGSEDAMSAGSAESDTMLLDESGGGSEHRRDSDRTTSKARRGADPESAPAEGGAETHDFAPNGSTEQGYFAGLAAPVRLRSDDLETGVRRALRVLEQEVPTTTDLRTLKRKGERCPAPPMDSGERSLPVRYDGAAAVLVAGPERQGLVEVTVYSCSGAELDDTRVRR